MFVKLVDRDTGNWSLINLDRIVSIDYTKAGYFVNTSHQGFYIRDADYTKLVKYLEVKE